MVDHNLSLCRGSASRKRPRLAFAGFLWGRGGFGRRIEYAAMPPSSLQQEWSKVVEKSRRWKRLRTPDPFALQPNPMERDPVSVRLAQRSLSIQARMVVQRVGVIEAKLGRE